MKKALIFLSVVCVLVAAAACTREEPEVSSPRHTIRLLGEFNPDDGGAYSTEISAYDAASKRLCITDGTGPRVRLVDISDPARPRQVKLVTLGDFGVVNSAAAANGVFAVAVNASDPQLPGSIVFISSEGQILTILQAGAMPDMVTFTPDGSHLLVANEGEPDTGYLRDPHGSVMIIPMDAGVEALTQESVYSVNFDGLAAASLPEYVRIVRPGATPAEDFEPEYIAVSSDSATAFVSLQENNAIAVISIRDKSLTGIFGLPFKDHSLVGNGLDASDRDGAIAIQPWPVWGMPQPDALAVLETDDGETYLVTANEGDAKDYEAFSEEARVSELELDPDHFSDPQALQNPAALGRLKTSTIRQGQLPDTGKYREILSFGTRSVSVYRVGDSGLDEVFDSGDTFESLIAERIPAHFNATNDDQDSFDSRSDDKGPEPEALAVARLDGRTYVLAGMERTGGIFIFDATDPRMLELVDFVIIRDFAALVSADTPGLHLGPEGMLFINADSSPTGKPLLVVTYEVSGSVVLFEFAPVRAAE